MTTKGGRRPVLWILVAVVLVAILSVVLLAASSLGAKSSTTSPSGTTTTSTTSACMGTSASQTVTIISGPVLVGATSKVAAGETCADGHLGTILSYTFGQPINVAVSVPSPLTPTLIQTVYDGTPQNTNPWNVTSTGRTYVLGYGGAGESPLTVSGTHNVYAIVTFSDGTSATSNLVYLTVAAGST